VRARSIAAAAAGVALAAAAGTGSAASAPPRIGDRPGFWPLSQLGSHAAIRISEPGTRVVARYRLSSGTRQGVPLWYTIRLHARFRFARRPGECILSAATNGLTAAQIIVKTGRRAAQVSSVGWIHGRRLSRLSARTARVDFRNYLQTKGPRPGRNTLTVTLDVLRGRCFDSLFVLPDSGIGATTVRPDELRLLVPQQPIVATAGHRTKLPFALRRRGGRPDVGLDVRLLLPEGFRAVDRTVWHFPRIGRVGSGTFEFVPKTTGRYVLSLAVPRRYNQPTANVQVDVVKPRSWLTTRFLPSLLAAVLLGGAAAFMYATRKAKNRTGSR
jgi:hypothetical protein